MDKDVSDFVVNYARKIFMKLTVVTVTKTFLGDPKSSFVPDQKKSLNGEEKSKTVMRLCQPPDGSTSPKYKLLHF